MHSNPAFRKAADAQNLAFARERGFGTLSIAVQGEVLSAHVPFVMDDAGGVVALHLARSNPILRHPGRAVLMVTGADGYISPDWYGVPDMVPTWNYIAVHLRGVLEVLDPSSLRPHLRQLSARFERQLDKPEWTLDKMGEESILRMERMIVPVRLVIDDIQGTWKLSQNKGDAPRLCAAAAVVDSHGQELADLATAMRNPPENQKG